MSISQLARSIKESPTLKLNEEAQTLRARGEAVINMGVGEPKNKAPITAVLGSAAKLNDGDVKYVPVDGTKSLKKAIIRYTEENYGRLVGPDNVIISTGAKQSLFNLLFSIIDPQDEVIILAPYWVSYPEMVKMVHGVPVIVTPEDGSFHPQMSEIEDAVSSYTKAIIVNSPNNPTGSVYSRAELEAIVEVAASEDIIILSDEIYEKLVYNGKKHVSVASLSEAAKNLTITINGLSKVYSMTGWRLGYTAAPQEIADAIETIQSHTTSNPTSFAQYGALAALQGDQGFVNDMVEEYDMRRQYMLSRLQKIRNIEIVEPEGAFYFLVDTTKMGLSSMNLTEKLLSRYRVAAIPGLAFGHDHSVRLSYATSLDVIKKGLDRFEEFCHAH